jgi:glycerol uptake facilitator-like aquaporin
MATAKSKKTKATSKKSSTKPKTTSVAKSVKETKPEVITTKKGMGKFFARKFDAKENILTIFKSPKIYGAILGELLGTMLLAIILLTLGIYQPLYVMFGLIAITVAVFGLSGANLNPFITVGMLATRRMSAIRGTLYIVAQVLGAWLGLLLVSAFAGAAGSQSGVTIPKMAELADKTFWTVTMIEMVGAAIFAFFFARALTQKQNILTFAAVIGCGLLMTIVFAVVVSGYFKLQGNFIFNPAIALMYQILPNGGDSFGDIIGKVFKALTTYAILPMIGGVVGFYLADLAGFLAGEEQK